MGAKDRTKTIAVKVTPEQSMVLAFLKETEKRSVSQLVYDAIIEKYNFDELFPVARSFFDSSVRLIEQTPNQQAD